MFCVYVKKQHDFINILIYAQVCDKYGVYGVEDRVTLSFYFSEMSLAN